jgi:lipid-binding SYLF domain-containing protein
MASPDKAIPDSVIKGAKCIVVIPAAVKSAVAFGGSHGKGVATCRNSSRWSAPAPITITGGAWGLQLGGQTVDVVMIVTNEKGMHFLLSSKFKLGADASVAAGPVGRNAATNTEGKAEILTYSRARGVFAGIALSGSAIEQDKAETQALYGKSIPLSDILTGKVQAHGESLAFQSAIVKYSSVSHDNQ